MIGLGSKLCMEHSWCMHDDQELSQLEIEKSPCLKRFGVSPFWNFFEAGLDCLFVS